MQLVEGGAHQRPLATQGHEVAARRRPAAVRLPERRLDKVRIILDQQRQPPAAVAEPVQRCPHVADRRLQASDLARLGARHEHQQPFGAVSRAGGQEFEFQLPDLRHREGQDARRQAAAVAGHGRDCQTIRTPSGTCGSGERSGCPVICVW